ncbi:ER membrane protein complex subunit 4-like isoform X1 [Anneissia japonica]|uniref:ER membrane protein complex subunit 4-like isoform X1 n=1 Tax=Anneissia japonica TaxID=1529436 RepID=UPI001425A35F|nr:ER membrane protein complex subunit 4-like isoform X1 [Anneissia japonica]
MASHHAGQLSGARSNKLRHKWTIDFNTKHTRELEAPVGFTSSSRNLDVTSQDNDNNSNLVDKKCWDIALAPLKQIPMNLFIMYMSGNSISIFPIMMVGMMVWRPIQAIMQHKKTFKMLDGSNQAIFQKCVFLTSNMLGVALALYKCSSMGLLPLYASDWLSFLDPQTRMEYSGGGVIL